MKGLLFSLLLLFTCLFVRSQQYDLKSNAYPKYQQGWIPNYQDTLFQEQLPELTMNDADNATTLPYMVDNSTLPYLRPVFLQSGASCGQASAVAYNFGYEMCMARGVSADTSIYQYPTHFAYNFENGGDAYFGVSYFHSFEILKKCGTMNVVDYGGLADDGKRWISGYDVYRKAMSNRIEDVYTIKTNTYKGILTLKNWIYNHLGNSTQGGVASFYSGSPHNYKQIPTGSPEAGKHIITNFPIPAAHAMCIVGYNDSVRYDYNNDGQFTNNIDLNNDQIIDIRDWEIGAFKFVNSYGVSGVTGGIDSGFCYMMYKTLAESYDNGGIWNTCVHVVKPKVVYEPKLTLKIKLKHNRRGSIKVSAGIGNASNTFIPEHEIDFPIFDFQGGNHFMQGYETNDTMQFIEFGLDITPLLSFSKKDAQNNIYLLVDENDPYGQVQGEIVSASIHDYSGQQAIEVPFDIVNLPLNDNTRTTVVKSVLVQNEPVAIATSYIPPITSGQPYSAQIMATGGTQPYQWQIVKDYSELNDNSECEPFAGTKVLAQLPSDSVMPVALPFGFPFYGKTYDTVYVNMNNGYLQFTKDKIPWPYYNDEFILFRSYKLILPISNQFVNAYTPEQGAWFQIENNSVKFRWQLSLAQGTNLIPYNSWLQLHPDGTIDFWRDNIEIPQLYKVYSGISNGDKENYNLNLYTKSVDANNKLHSRYIPCSQLLNTTIDTDGKLEMFSDNDSVINPIRIKVTDYNNISTTKEFQVSNGLRFEARIRSGTDTILEPGETGKVDLTIFNTSTTAIQNIAATIKLQDSKIVFNDSTCFAASLLPNSNITINDAFTFQVANNTEDKHTCIADLHFSFNNVSRKSKLVLTSYAPIPRPINIQSTKPNNEPVNPGEDATFRIRIENKGHSTATNVQVKILDTPYFEVKNNSSFVLPILQPGELKEVELEGSILKSVPLGKLLGIPIETSCNQLAKRYDTLVVRAGRSPVLVLDLDVTRFSSPVIYEKIKNLGYLCDYTNQVLSTINEYQSIFINLGRQTNRHILTFAESHALMTYLDQGGSIYMEGRNTWRDDPVSPLHPRFLVSTTNKIYKGDTIEGVTNTFTRGLGYVYDGPISIGQYYLNPINTSFPILKVDDYNVAVANDAHTYKTIAAIFDLAGFQGLDSTSTLDTLLLEFIKFFELKKSLNIEDPFLNDTKPILCFPNPAYNSVKITFQDEQNQAAKVDIYTLQGIKITTLNVPVNHGNATRTIDWDLSNYAGTRVKSGIYLCRIASGSNIYTGKIIVL